MTTTFEPITPPASSTPSTASARSTRSARLPWVAVGGAAAFAAIVVGAGLAEPGYSSRREAVSALAATDAHHAGFVIAGFVALAIGLVAAGVQLRRSLLGRAGTVGAGFVTAGGLGLLVAGFARQDCSTYLDACAAREEAGTVSGHHVVHELGSMVVFLLLLAGLFVTARALRRTPALAHLARQARVAAGVATALLVAGVAEVAGSSGGWVQRLFLGVLVGWVVRLVLATRPPRST